MAKIFCIVGASCSGKDTIFNNLLDMHIGLTPIITYTTRPIRANENNGKEYYFVNRRSFSKLKHQGKVIEYRTYKTVHGDRYYGYKIVMKNGVTFWVKTSGPKVYDYISEYIPDQITNVPPKKSKHLNTKLRKNE